MATEGDGVGQPGIERAYVSAESGIAVATGATTTAPDQIYVEFSQAVVVDGAVGGAVPADGFSLDGTVAGIETVEAGAVAGDTSGSGSQVLVLSLSTGITADERPRLTYRPGPGDVQTPAGAEPTAVTGIGVTPGSPRVLDVSVLARRGDAVRICFDRPVSSRTDDATMFSLTDAGGNSLLDGDIAVDESRRLSSANQNAKRSGDVDENRGFSSANRTQSGDVDRRSPSGSRTQSGDVDGTRVTLPLTRDVTEAMGQNDNPFTLRYRGGGSDTERLHNLVGEKDVPVQRFSEPLDFEVETGGFEILEASIPRTPNATGVADRTSLELWFAPPVEAESAAGYELQNTLATVAGLGPLDADAPNSPDVVLELDAPIDPTDEPNAAVQYDPARGDTVAAGNETPSSSLSTAVETVGIPPEPREARLAPDGESLTVQFDRAVGSQYEDATGLTLSGAGNVELAGSVDEGKQVTLELSDALVIEDTSNTVRIHYSTQGDNGRRYNLLSREAGVPLQSFTLDVKRADDTPAVEYVRMPEERRDRIVVRFDRPVSAESTAGFSLDGPVARVEELASVDGLDDDLVPYTLVLGLHVDVTTDAATLVYDGDEGTVTGENGGAPESFQAEVQMLPPAPTLQRAVVPAGEAELRAEFDRPVTLNHDDATGFSLTYEADRDDLATLTDRVHVDTGTLVFETDGTIDLTADPKLGYEPDDEGGNVLGTDEGVRAATATVPVAAGENDGYSGGGDDPTQGPPCDDSGGVPTLVDARIPESAPDHVVCEFDAPVDAGVDAFTVEDADLRAFDVLNTGGPTELTLELSGEVPPDATLKVIYQPGA